jgi:tetratricopeptide (TPR) repeat protein
VDSYLAQAIIQCQQAIETEADNPEKWQAAFRNVGNLLQGRAEFDRAVIWHSLALESQLNLAEIHCQLGELHILENNWTAALSSFENALEYLPNSARIYSSLAQVNNQLEQREAEIDCWYKAAQLNPELINKNGYYKLAKALEQAGKIDEAVECYQKATADNQGIVAAFFDLAEIYLRQRKVDLAQAIYEQVLTAEPTEPRARYKLGTIYLQKRSFEQAIDCFHQTIKNAPDFPWAYRDLVKTFLILQRWDEAISTCYAILNLVEEYPWVYSHLGNALREKGRLREAAANFQKACQHRGWKQCADKDYFFTLDMFSHRIASWLEHLKPLVGRAIEVLQIGCYQGMSACWILDEMLSHEASKLTLIDRDFEGLLKENIVKTGFEAKVTFLEGKIHQLIVECTPNSFDLINLQDRCRLNQHVEKDARLAWNLLKPGGFMVFGGYGWRNPRDPQQNPQEGIDRFLDSTKNQWQIVHLSAPTFQLIVRKL